MTKTHKIYFHVSPEANITQFRGRFSKKFNQKGIFVCPKFRNICLDWAPYVAYKKHPRDNANRYKEHYRNLTVYKISISKDIISECQNLYNECYESALKKVGEGNENSLLGAWGWGPELFIPEKYFQQLLIIDNKTYRYHDLLKQGFPFFYQRHIAGQDKTIYAYAKKSNNFVAKFYIKMFDASTDLALKYNNSNLIKNFNNELNNLIKFIIKSDLFGFEAKLIDIKDISKNEAFNEIKNIENKFLTLSRNLSNLKENANA